jgi:hypothetical protein
MKSSSFSNAMALSMRARAAPRQLCMPYARPRFWASVRSRSMSNVSASVHARWSRLADLQSGTQGHPRESFVRAGERLWWRHARLIATVTRSAVVLRPQPESDSDHQATTASDVGAWRRGKPRCRRAWSRFRLPRRQAQASTRMRRFRYRRVESSHRHHGPTRLQLSEQIISGFGAALLD